MKTETRVEDWKDEKNKLHYEEGEDKTNETVGKLKSKSKQEMEDTYGNCEVMQQPVNLLHKVTVTRGRKLHQGRQVTNFR